MKFQTLVILAVLNAGTMLAQGRLLDSELEFSQRFGPPVSKAKADEYGSRMISYSKDGWRIRAWFVNDECHKISYFTANFNRPTPDQIDALMQANSGGYTWAIQKDKMTAANLILQYIGSYVRSDKEAYCDKNAAGVTFKSSRW